MFLVMELVLTEAYLRSLRRLAKLGATAADVEAMEQAVAADPSVGVVVRGTGGLRKVRFGYGRSGKSGDGRTIYFAATASGQVFMLLAFAKADQADPTTEQRKSLATLVKELTS